MRQRIGWQNCNQPLTCELTDGPTLTSRKQTRGRKTEKNSGGRTGFKSKMTGPGEHQARYHARSLERGLIPRNDLFTPSTEHIGLQRQGYAHPTFGKLEPDSKYLQLVSSLASGCVIPMLKCTLTISQNCSNGSCPLHLRT